MKQSEVWDTLADGIEFEGLKRNVAAPDEFQRELKQYLDALYEEGSRIIEVGSFTGVTSLILDDRYAKTLLDLNGKLLQLSEHLFSSFQKQATFVQADMFQMPFPDESFDVVFNAGVIEHFDAGDRGRAIKEYGRILKPNGTMVIAFPNHYSSPYRLTYKFLNWIKSWPYPLEERIYDLETEAANAGLAVSRRAVMAQKTALDYLFQIKVAGRFLRPFFSLVGYEGYLTVVTIKKKDS